MDRHRGRRLARARGTGGGKTRPRKNSRCKPLLRRQRNRNRLFLVSAFLACMATSQEQTPKCLPRSPRHIHGHARACLTAVPFAFLCSRVSPRSSRASPECPTPRGFHGARVRGKQRHPRGLPSVFPLSGGLFPSTGEPNRPQTSSRHGQRRAVRGLLKAGWWWGRDRDGEHVRG